jgi:hypothetical protein
VIRRINGQVRKISELVLLSGGGIASNTYTYGVDFSAVLAYARRIGAPEALIAELLPDIEGILVRSQRAEPEA